MFEHLYPSLIFVCVLTSEENDNKKQYPSNYFKNSNPTTTNSTADARTYKL